MAAAIVQAWRSGLLKEGLQGEEQRGKAIQNLCLSGTSQTLYEWHRGVCSRDDVASTLQASCDVRTGNPLRREPVPLLFVGSAH